VDQLKGFTIFLVVYGHNFPLVEKYIYSFHMPLFIMVAGFFHPKISQAANIKKRFQSIMAPYFIWSAMLFLFWLVLGRKYGDSGTLDLSIVKNFMGIFYAQGDREYMDWGIPLWFLPALFVTFVLMHFLQKLKNAALYKSLMIIIPVVGFAYNFLSNINLPWSINIAMVGLLFYEFGKVCFPHFIRQSQMKTVVWMLAAGVISILLYDHNVKVDMYRAIYGNVLLFIMNGLSGSLLVICFFKAFPYFKFLEFIGKFSLTILAAQLLAMTFIKLMLMVLFNQSHFNFTEWERFFYAILQILILIPGFFIINKYVPILNGGYKKI
jgi:fucose 4-O-acetylase-like acetyltransferase